MKKLLVLLFATIMLSSCDLGFGYANTPSYWCQEYVRNEFATIYPQYSLIGTSTESLDAGNKYVATRTCLETFIIGTYFMQEPYCIKYMTTITYKLRNQTLFSGSEIREKDIIDLDCEIWNGSEVKV